MKPISELKKRATDVALSLRQAYQHAYDEVIAIVKEHGGFIDTRACDEKPTLYAVTDNSNFDKVEDIAIQAIRYDEDSKSLFILSNTELENYTYDTKYYFNYFYNFEGEDAEHLNDAMKDLTYFRDIDDGYTDIHATILNIAYGLFAYLD